jgi:hypothetical protein
VCDFLFRHCREPFLDDGFDLADRILVHRDGIVKDTSYSEHNRVVTIR